MTRSSSTVHGVSASDQRSSTTPSRHDLLLATVPTVFVLSLLVGQLFSVSVQVSLVVASAVSALAIADGLFRNPPVSGGR